jgi:hypothetical protein
MRMFFTRRRKVTLPKVKPKRRLKAACLTLGLATAWGGEAVADATLKIEITPQQTLTNALVYYGNNISTGVLRSLGTLPGGQTSTVFHTFIANQVPFEESWSWTADSYVPGLGHQPAVYAVIGLYEGAEGTGVSVSFSNDDPITAMATWSSIFDRDDQITAYRYTEASIVDYLQEIDFFPNYPQVVQESEVKRFLESYSSNSRPYLHSELATEYGQSATLVNFSDAAFGGTVIVQLVPEPATWCFIVGVAGIGLARWRRRSVC